MSKSSTASVMWMFGLKKRNSMKRTIFISIFFAAFVLPFSVACGGDETEPQQQEQPDTPESPDEPDTPSSGNGKVLVAYFSRANHVPDGTDAVSGATNKTRNTQTVAMELSRLTGGDLFEIIPARDYPVSHTECSEIALQEYEADARPALTTHVDNMEDYDIIYIGFPMALLRADGNPHVPRRVRFYRQDHPPVLYQYGGRYRRCTSEYRTSLSRIFGSRRIENIL